MGKVGLGARILLGLIFFVFGLNGFLNFMPAPPEIPGIAGELVGAFVKTGYMFPLIKGTEVLAGALLLSGFFVPLALILLAPIVVNIACFHVLLMHDGYPMVIALIVLMLVVAYDRHKSFHGVLQAK